jgi:2-dehydro-3-deoxyphosphogluconate aldolase/(4S)-4-hydroxy-2-oxoglutarate aldolase
MGEIDITEDDLSRFAGRGLAMLRAIRVPLPQLRIVPVGGVTLDHAAEYMRSGAAALRIGSALINQDLLDAGDLAELTRRAAAFIAAVKTGRGE